MARPFSAKDKKGMVIFGLVFAALLVLAAAQHVLRPDASRYDPLTLCPKDRSYPHTVVLLDKTDPFSRTQQAFLRDRLKQIRDHMAKYEKLSIYVLEDAAGVGEARFAMCNPGSGKDANELYQNPQKIEQHFREQFGGPLDRLLAGLLEGQSRPRSAIIEAIREVAAQPDFRDPQQRRRLVVFSDMIHNTTEFSQYSNPQSFEKFAKTDYGDWSLRTSLARAEVAIVYLLRPEYKAAQNRGHTLFWEKYFHALGADLKEVDPIQ